MPLRYHFGGHVEVPGAKQAAGRIFLRIYLLFCVTGYQAQRSRSVKTATDGRRHRDTYTNQKAPKNTDKYRATSSPPMRTKSS